MHTRFIKLAPRSTEERTTTTPPRYDQFPRTHAIYMTRAAETHLALHDLDAAVNRAYLPTRCLGGVDSARSGSTITGLRKKLAAHAGSPAVRDFLEATR